MLNNTKFKQEGRFDMAYGPLALFYGGLEALIGPPTMVDGSLIKSMEQVRRSGTELAAVFGWRGGSRDRRLLRAAAGGGLR